MLPQGSNILQQQIKIVKKPSRTYRMDTGKNRISGYTDGLEAIRQAVYCILNTERYDWLIYSWNYGVKLKDLFGKPKPYVKSELKRRITEALLCDDRIERVSDFTFREEGGKLQVNFTVFTALGEIPAQKEVRI